jgi:hypothetical protein
MEFSYRSTLMQGTTKSASQIRTPPEEPEPASESVTLQPELLYMSVLQELERKDRVKASTDSTEFSRSC